MKQHRVAILGGAGFIGRYVVKRLAERGDVLTVGGRSAAYAKFLKLKGDVGQVGAPADRRLAAGHCGGWDGPVIAQPRDDLAEGARGPDVDTSDQRRLGTVRFGDDDPPEEDEELEAASLVDFGASFEGSFGAPPPPRL